MALVKCKDCKYYHKESEECWRLPPVVRTKNPVSAIFVSIRPHVEKDTKCGEGVAEA